jgi:hypothetical protein
MVPRPVVPAQNFSKAVGSSFLGTKKPALKVLGISQSHLSKKVDKKCRQPILHLKPVLHLNVLLYLKMLSQGYFVNQPVVHDC